MCIPGSAIKGATAQSASYLSCKTYMRVCRLGSIEGRDPVYSQFSPGIKSPSLCTKNFCARLASTPLSKSMDVDPLNADGPSSVLVNGSLSPPDHSPIGQRKIPPQFMSAIPTVSSANILMIKFSSSSSAPVISPNGSCISPRDATVHLSPLRLATVSASR